MNGDFRWGRQAEFHSVSFDVEYGDSNCPADDDLVSLLPGEYEHRSSSLKTVPGRANQATIEIGRLAKLAFQRKAQSSRLSSR